MKYCDMRRRKAQSGGHSLKQRGRLHRANFMLRIWLKGAEQAAGKLLYYDYAKQSPVMLEMFRFSR